MGHIYKITNPNGKIYVGKTEREIKQRIADHRWKGQKRNLILANSIKKYGWSSHKFEVIEEVDNALLNEREIFWIAELKSYCYENKLGMNMTKGGEGQRSTWIHDEERRADQSKRYSGEGNPFFGKTHNEDTRKILSEKASERNLKSGKRVPDWGSEKGLNAIRRPVVAYDNKGKKKGEYISLTECAKKLRINRITISDSLKWGSWAYGKYKFFYIDGKVPDTIDVPEKIHIKQEKKAVVCIDRNNIRHNYIGIKEASKALSVSPTTIAKLANLDDGTPMKQLSKRYRFFWKDKFK